MDNSWFTRNGVIKHGWAPRCLAISTAELSKTQDFPARVGLPIRTMERARQNTGYGMYTKYSCDIVDGCEILHHLGWLKNGMFTIYQLVQNFATIHSSSM